MIQADKAEPSRTRRNEKEKRKRRKLKKKKQALPHDKPTNQSTVMTNETNGHTVEELPQPLSIGSDTSASRKPPMSPRKQTILRHQKSSDLEKEPSFLSEAKQFKKTRKTVPAPQPSNSNVSEDGKYHSILTKQIFEDRASIFKHLQAKIVVCHEQLHAHPAEKTSGTLLGHGELEIFQLHNGDVTYLACGSSFVYPLLPKLKILRIAFNQFVLPLVNPERYWKITLETTDPAVIARLESVLGTVVRYTNMHSSSAAHLQRLQDQSLETITAMTPPHEGLRLSEAPLLRRNDERSRQDVDANLNWSYNNAQMNSPHAGHGERFSNRDDQFTPYFNSIPESPPSAPASPQLLFENIDPLSLNPPHLMNHWEMSRDDHLGQILASTLASFSLDDQMNGPVINASAKPHQANPTSHPPHHSDPLYRHQNPFQSKEKPKVSAANKSDTSSMDSLLDEYEDNISTTKSLNYNVSRPPSRTMSLASSVHQSAILYQRGRLPLVPDNISNMGSTKYEVHDNDDTEDEEMLKTSLSRYNRARQQSQSQKSRRSSPSELYTSVSNWMEPNVQTRPTLGHSRSNYSLASARNSVASSRSQANNLREIYRSITERNLHNIIQKDVGRKPSVDSERLYHDSRPKIANQTSSSHRGGNSNYPPKPSSNYGAKISAARNQNQKKDSLTSSDVYKLVSSRNSPRDTTTEAARSGGFSRLFGW